MNVTPRRAPDRQRPTMVDVARHAGVSLKTVSRVVNNAPHVQQRLVEKVLAAVEELGFQRNQLASALRSGQQTATVGLLIEDIANPFYAMIAQVTAEVAASFDSLLITASSEEDPVREERLLRDLCSRRVDGLLVVPAGDDHSFLKPEVERGLPVVFLDRPGGGIQADTVLLDNHGGAETAMKQLVAQGHRRVAVLLDSTGVFTMRERLSGALAALPDAVVREQAHDPATAACAVAGLLDGPDPPTAFFGLNNRITVGIVQELCRRGSRAAVMGFDDFELSHLMPIPLTVIAYDTRELARQAAELLFARIARETFRPRTVILSTTLIQRGLAVV